MVNIINIKIKNKKTFPYLVIGVLGIIIAAVSFYFLVNRFQEPILMKDITVTARSIPMYETIRGSDLKVIQVPESTDTTKHIIDMTDIVGKASKVPLSANEVIMEEYLVDRESIGGVDLITINTLYAKTGGAKSGDVVDIWKVKGEKGDWVEGAGSTLIAKDVVVVSLTTGLGKEVGTGTNEKIETVKLAVKPQYTKFIVSGAVDIDNGYVLVVKTSFSKDDAELDPDVQEVLDQEEFNEDTMDNIESGTDTNEGNDIRSTETDTENSSQDGIDSNR